MPPACSYRSTPCSPAQLLPDLLPRGKHLGLVTDQLLIQPSKIHDQAKSQRDSAGLLHEVSRGAVLAPAGLDPSLTLSCTGSTFILFLSFVSNISMYLSRTTLISSGNESKFVIFSSTCSYRSSNIAEPPLLFLSLPVHPSAHSTGPPSCCFIGHFHLLRFIFSIQEESLETL